MISLATLAVGMAAQSAQAQTSELTGQVKTVTRTVSDVEPTLRMLFNDYRVQAVVVVILVVLGLALWLLGARVGRLLFALLLGTAAIVPGMYLALASHLSPWPGALAGGVVGMLAGIFIFRIGIMLVGMCISTLLAVGIFAVIGMESTDLVNLKNTVQDCLISVGQENLAAPAYSAGLANEQMDHGVALGNYQQGAMTIRGLANKYRNGLMVSAVIGLAVGLLLQIFAGSFMLVLTTATLGTAMVLFGVWLGLAFRGQKPEEILRLKPVSSVVIFLVMLSLGILVQLTMARKRAEVEPEEEEKKEEEE